MRQQKRIKEIDRLHGIGALESADNETLKAKYDLHILREMVQADSGEELPGALDVQGHVAPLSQDLFLEPGSEFKLILSDGGTLDIIITGTGFNFFDIATRDARDFARRYER